MDTDEEGGENELERNVNYLHDIMKRKTGKGKKYGRRLLTGIVHFEDMHSLLLLRQPNDLGPPIPTLAWEMLDLETPLSFTKTVLAIVF